MSLPRSLLLVLKRSQKEEEILEQVKAAVAEGKAKIEERFEELTKEFHDSLEREKRLVKDQYVSL